MPPIYLVAFWILGIFLGSQLRSPPPVLLGSIFGILFLMLWLGWGWRSLRYACFALFLLGAGVLRYHQHLPSLAQHPLVAFHDRGPVELQGIVVAEPEVRERTTHLQVAVHSLRGAEGWQPLADTILVVVRPYPAYGYGDELRLVGTPQIPPSGGTFDYRTYLARQGLHTMVDFPRVERLAAGKGWQPLELLLGLKGRLAEALAASLPEPQASLAQGMLLGLRSTIPQDLWDAFNRSGTSHLIVISGQNISMIGGLFLFLGMHLRGRPTGLLLALAAIALYTVLVGAAPPVLRAAIMGGLTFLAMTLGRQQDAVAAWLVAAALMTALDPFLLWSVSFQLSFAATAGLVFLVPFVQRALPLAVLQGGERSLLKLSHKLLLEGLLVTLATTFAIVPILAVNFQRLSLIAPLANLLAVLAFLPIFLTSALTAALGAMVAPLGQVAGWVAWIPLTYLIRVAESTAALPGAWLRLGAWDTPLTVAYYGALGLLWWAAQQREPLRRLRAMVKEKPACGGRLAPGAWLGVASALLVANLLLWAAVLVPRERLLRVTVLDVGQGDALLLQAPSGTKVLVDGGPTGQALLTALGRQLPFWDRHLDLVVLTHAQADHLEGLVALLGRYRVAQVLEADPASGPLYDAWLTLLAQKGIPRHFAQRGQQIPLGQGVTLEVRHPEHSPASLPPPNLNERSVVLRLVAGQVSFLLTGDIQAEAQLQLLGHEDSLSGTVLKVPHHGGYIETNPRFFREVAPVAAAISVGRANPFGHPVLETLHSLEGAAIYRTDQQGDIVFFTDGRRLWVQTGR